MSKSTANLILIFRLFAAFLVLAQVSNHSHAQLKNNRLFKVDPLGAAFHEFRFSVENRIKDDYFWYLSPYVHLQNSLSTNQRYYGAGFRAGARKYFKTENSPQGFFLQPDIAYRFTAVTNFNPELSVDSRYVVHSPGIAFTAGYQWMHGRHDNLAYGFMGGFEYYFDFLPGDAPNDLLKENWYQLPFSWKPPFLKGLKLYLGIELGFAFRQKHLHW